MRAEDPRDRRIYRRMRLSTRVDLMLDDGEGFVSEATGDLSEGGMFIATADPLPVGTAFVFGLRPRRGFPPVRGRAEVVWNREDSAEGVELAGMGVRFLDLGDDDRTTIRSMLVFETEVEMDFVADESAQAKPREVAPALSPELRELSDVFPPPGETGIGFFAVQEEANRQREKLQLKARRRRARRAVLLASLAALFVSALWLLWSHRPELGPWWANLSAPAGVAARGEEASVGSAEVHVSPVAGNMNDEAHDRMADTLGPATAVLDLECGSDERGAVVRIRGNGSFLAQQLRFEALQSPPRFVIRILGISHPFTRADSAPTSPQVLGVRIGHHPELDVPQLFVVLDLASAELYSLPPEIEGAELVIRLVDGAAGLS